jgi:ferredoxin-NADP reductase
MKLKLKEIKEELQGVKTLVFEPENELNWIAGQFLHYVLHHRPTDDRGSDRWFTIASAPHEKVVKITTRFNNEKSSTFKTTLEEMKVGDNIEISELEGDFTVEDPARENVFIAGGIGVTPFYAILKDLEYKKYPINVTLLYANRDENIVYKDQLEEIAQNNPNFKIQYIISPDKINVNKLKDLIENLDNKIFYISGPEPMVDSLGTQLKEIGIKEENIKQDWFPGYPEE